MATLPDDTIEQQGAGHSSGQIPPINKWLKDVDNQLAPYDLPLLKLCLYPLFTSWARASKADSPSQLFHHLHETSSKEDESQQRILHSFLCALRVIGGRHRGIICIAKLKEYGLEQPQGQEESEEFRFFQCYARVARDVAEEYGAKEKIEKAYDRRLGKNYRHYDHVADLFIAIYQAQRVRPDSCDEFYGVLRRCKEVDKYIRVMEKCKILTGDMWSDTSSEPSSLDASETYFVISCHEEANEYTPILRHRSTSQSRSQVTSQKDQKHKLRLVCILLAVCISFLIIAGLLGGSIYSIYECRGINQDDNVDKAVEGNAIMILAEIQPAMTGKVTVTEQVLYQESPHKVHLFLAEYGCDQLPTLANDSEHRNGSHLENITAVYLLPGSTINYTITVSTPENIQKNIDVFIVKGLESIAHFDPNENYPKRVPIGPQGADKTTSIFYSIDSPEYYAIFFLIPPTVPVSMSFNSSLRSEVIDISQLSYTYNHTLSSDDDTWEQSLGWEKCSHRKCLVAEIGPGSSDTNKFVHLTIDSMPRYAERVYTPLFSSSTAVCGLVLVVLVLIPMCVFVASKNRKRILEVRSTPIQ